MIALKIENLKKTYKVGIFKKKKVEALKGISIQIEEGEIFGFLGPNGAGKTTAILSMLDLIKKDSGKIFFFEKEIKNNSEMFKDIGYVPEEPYLYNYLKVEEFLYLGAKLSNFEEKNLKEKIENYLKLFNLYEKKDNIIKNLSKGQKQRVLLSLNFLIQPKILILDEPFRGLDPIGIKSVRDEILVLSQAGKTVFLSSHIISEVEMICNKVSIINNGEIVWEGNPKQIHSKECSFKVYFKLKKQAEENIIEKKFYNQDDLIEFLKEINLTGGEIIEILQEKGLEDYFHEKIREN